MATTDSWLNPSDQTTRGKKKKPEKTGKVFSGAGRKPFLVGWQVAKIHDCSEYLLLFFKIKLVFCSTTRRRTILPTSRSRSGKSFRTAHTTPCCCWIGSCDQYFKRLRPQRFNFPIDYHSIFLGENQILSKGNTHKSLKLLEL